MKIALYGYGRMGKAIEETAARRGHTIALKVGRANAGTPPAGCDMAIEFSTPDQAVANLGLCLTAGVPVVMGTTGWYDRMDEAKELVRAHNGALLWASNFSIGVNLLFRMNKYLASLMDTRPDYRVRIDEVHHSHKLDAPSGTAIILARDIDLKTQRYTGWSHPIPSPSPVGKGEIPITSERVGEVPGKHSITWASMEDRITITHEAFGRQGFALGAVIAAEWLCGRTGFFTMDDVLDAAH